MIDSNINLPASPAMVKPLSFKGDKKIKKRKHRDEASDVPTTRPDAAADADSEETWTTADIPSDISGPIMILLPQISSQSSSSEDSTPGPATCLASDPTGTCFASPVENIIPETPARLSAEPSDVRQVWVATKVPGENSGWTLKSHQGRYLGADKTGIVSCEKEAAGMEEVFWFTGVADAKAAKASKQEGRQDIKEEDEEDEKEFGDEEVAEGGFVVQTSRKTFLSMSLPSSGRSAGQLSIRADAETIDARSTLFVRMQSRYKPKLQASRELKAKEKVSRKQLEEAVGRRLEDDEVRRLVDEARENARRILTERRVELDRLAAALVQYETLDKDEIMQVVKGEKRKPAR